MTILIIAIALALVAILVYSLRFFTIEHVAAEDEADEAGKAVSEQEQGAEEPREIINLVDYFDKGQEASGDGDEAEAGAEAKTAADPDVPLVLFDRLSELKTGRGYLVDAQRLLDHAKEKGAPYTAVYFDFDRFRFINSLKGYAIGDYCLTHIAQQMRNVFPSDAECARISADHFAVVFPLGDEKDFEVYAGQLKRACEKIRSDTGIKSGLHISMGIAIADQLDKDYDITVLLLKANIARHCMKGSKSELFNIYDETMLTSYLYGQSALEDYNENQFGDEFNIYYQPITDLKAKRLVSCEALVRWTCEVETNKDVIITPDNGRIPSNNFKVVYQVCKAMSRWRKAGKEAIPVLVHLPVTVLFMQDIDEFLGKCLTEFQLEPKMLIAAIEVSAVRLDWSTSSHQVKKLKELGVQVGVDGIDLGYKSLDFLTGLQISFIKLHQSFASNVHSNDERYTAVQHMLSMAAALNLRVIFEGVDTTEQLSTLDSLGVREVQGRTAGKAMSGEEFGRELQEYVQRKHSDTVILDDKELVTGDFKLY